MALKERDIEDRIKNMGFERGAMFVLLEQTGEIKQLEKALIDLAKQVDQMAEMMAQFVTVAGNMKDAHQRVLRMLPSDDDSLPRPSEDRKLT
jgi:tRNA threonylcarbamoyladenosine modification (KEOPS) complex Cgi121 subunit